MPPTAPLSATSAPVAGVDAGQVGDRGVGIVVGAGAPAYPGEAQSDHGGSHQFPAIHPTLPVCWRRGGRIARRVKRSPLRARKPPATVVLLGIF